MMQALKFYFPSCGNDQDVVMEHMWKQGIMSYLTFVRRMSLRGNPCIKGVFILNDTTPSDIPSEFECIPLSKEALHCLVIELQEELSMENKWCRIRLFPLFKMKN